MCSNRKDESKNDGRLDLKHGHLGKIQTSVLTHYLIFIVKSLYGKTRGATLTAVQ